MKKYFDYLDKKLPSLNNLNIIVTGSNAGIGFYAAMFLAYKKASVIMACRNENKAKQAKQKILEIVPYAKIHIESLDLASFQSISDFCGVVRQKYPKIDVLINNAGVYHLPKSKTADDYEIIMGTNYIGTYVLTNKILTHLSKNPNSRIIFTYSLAHRWGKIDYNNFFLEKKYKHIKAYANSKLALCKYATYLANMLENEKKYPKIVLVHPGVSATNLINSDKGGFSKSFSKLGTAFLKIFVHSPQKACMGLVIAAGADWIENKDSLGPRGFMEVSGYPKKRKLAKKVYVNQEELIKYTEKITDIKFTNLKGEYYENKK